MTLQIVTANRLIDGAVVYLTAENVWSPGIADARVLDDDQTASDALGMAHVSAGRNEVVDPYLIGVVQEARTITPLRYRETIRASGPSTHPRSPRRSPRSALPPEAVAAGITITMAVLNGT